MEQLLPQQLKALAAACPAPLYLVGGFVRDFLRQKVAPMPDFDLASPLSEEEFIAVAQGLGFCVLSVFRGMGTVKLKDGQGTGYEFTRFRTDLYERGMHAPTAVAFTTDIEVDARRRDFCANAVYYDIAAGRFVDPLGGIQDIRRGVLRTVDDANKVFGEDGLRLMRLARQTAETGFSPDEACLAGARANAALIRDIVPERVFHELDLLLHADEKGGEPYRGLCILRESTVLAHIMPELWAGNGMPQRSDFHNYDVLEHSFRCVKYAAPAIRFAALLHDVGKPLCQLRDGNVYAHAEEGARLARDVLTRLKAPKKLIAETETLTRLHIRLAVMTREQKLRRMSVEYAPLLPALLALFQADHSACKDDLAPSPAVVRWQALLAKMKAEGAPRTLKELKVDGNALQRAGVPPRRTGEALHALLLYAAEDGARNCEKKLLARAKKYFTDQGERTP